MKIKKQIYIFCALALLISSCSTAYKENSQFENTTYETDIDSFCQNSPDSCEAAINLCDDECNAELYGGIKQRYVVKGCRVTIFNDGPVEMVHEKTSEPCNAPIPQDHDFGGTKRVYKENGCTITEYTHKDGVGEAVMDCSEKDTKK